MPKPPYTRSSDGTIHQGKTLTSTQVSLGLNGQRLASIALEMGAFLRFEDATIGISAPFRLTVNSESQHLDPEVGSTLGPLLAIAPGTLQSALITPTLTLRLEFADGAVIEVVEHPSFEAWEIAGPGSRRIICPPAGGDGLSVWL